MKNTNLEFSDMVSENIDNTNNINNKVDNNINN